MRITTECKNQDHNEEDYETPLLERTPPFKFLKKIIP